MAKELLGEAFVILEETAPIIAEALGSPKTSTVALLALHILGRAFGVYPKQISDLKDALLTNPETKNKLENLQTQLSVLNKDLM